MSNLDEFSYIWTINKEKYVVLDDEYGKSVLFINDNRIMFVLIEDDELANQVIDRMIFEGNKIYTDINELQNLIRDKKIE